MEKKKIYIKLESEFNSDDERKSFINNIRTTLGGAYFISSAIMILIFAFVENYKIGYSFINILGLIVLIILFINSMSFIKLKK